ncbi:hypothetical protein [Hyphomonas sp.]|uniref:hypothetical protein n=1 Tax=Hyphomonas sp. TaxID=87 RepID=UPI00391A7B14
MKTEINLAPAADMVIESVMRPAMVNEVTGPMLAPRRAEAAAEPARLNILARRYARWDRRAVRG